MKSTTTKVSETKTTAKQSKKSDAGSGAPYDHAYKKGQSPRTGHSALCGFKNKKPLASTPNNKKPCPKCMEIVFGGK